MTNHLAKRSLIPSCSRSSSSSSAEHLPSPTFTLKSPFEEEREYSVHSVKKVGVVFGTGMRYAICMCVSCRRKMLGSAPSHTAYSDCGWIQRLAVCRWLVDFAVLHVLAARLRGLSVHSFVGIFGSGSWSALYCTLLDRCQYLHNNDAPPRLKCQKAGQ